jgi:hypothetical protein
VYVHLLPDDIPDVAFLDELTDGVSTPQDVPAQQVEAAAEA